MPLAVQNQPGVQLEAPYPRAYMFDALTTRFESVFTGLRGRGKLAEKDIDQAAGEVQVAFRGADVNVGVDRDFLGRVTESLGEDVSASESAPARETGPRR